MLTKEDKEFLKQKQISEETLNHQLTQHREGFPFLKLVDAASPEKGILIVNDDQRKKYLEIWNQYLQENHKVQKFVPASGAASRMFKNLFEFLDGESDTPDSDFIKKHACFSLRKGEKRLRITHQIIKEAYNSSFFVKK